MKKERFKKKMAVFLGMVLLTSFPGITGCKKDSSVQEEEIVLKWYIPNSDLEDLDMVMEEFNKRLYEKAGFKLELRTIPQDDYADKMMMNLSSGEDFDLMFVGWLNPYARMVESDYLYDITEMVENSPIKDTMPQYVWEGTRINDRIYAVPNYQVLFEQHAVKVRKDLVDKYNLDISTIKKTEDIEPFLKLIQENEPDLYPFRINFHETSFGKLVSDERQCEWASELVRVFVNEDGDVECIPFYEDMDYVDCIYKLREWYEKGYIRKDAANISNDDEDFGNQKYAVSMDHYKPGGLVDFYRRYDFEVVEIPVTERFVGSGAQNAATIAINKKSKHPEEAFKLIEIINTDKELYNMLVFGLEGVHYDKIGENRIHIKEDGKHVIQAWKVGNQFNAYLIDNQDEKDWDNTKKGNEESKITKLNGFFVDNSKIKRENNQVWNVFEKYRVMFTGAVDLDDIWDTMISELEQAGIRKICEETERQAQEFINKNKTN